MKTSTIHFDSPRENLCRAVVVGAAGYSGAELVGILLKHRLVDLIGLFGSAARADQPPRFDQIFPRFRGWTDLHVHAATTAAILALKPDAVFLATPHEASHDLAPALCAAGITVLDLSAAFRLRDAAAYPKHYAFTHAHPDLLARAVYGIAELNRAAISEAQLIAVPGCYPTSVVLAIRPLIAAGLTTEAPIIVDSTSGVSGAGRSLALKSLFCEVSQQPYGVFSHRHQPEMAQETGGDIIFTPHLGPFDRGILSTIHLTLRPTVVEGDVRAILNARYASEPFVTLLKAGEWPSVAAVEGSNRCDIGLAFDPVRHHLIVCSALDNLLKGAAGQAVQCFNIRFGFPETLGFAAPSIAASTQSVASGVNS
ncbi:MAG: N-acetyl-gamma-glutamyl-phosphate reductase [Phycisphaerales bacterium]|nr:N-acetyl-gamma-glutamyl-phosphate reductase [Phycisphaerales bacterium]